MGQSISKEVALGSIALLALCWKATGAYLNYYFTRKMTVVYELPKLGKPRDDGTRIPGTVVIIGGSMAGMWTARICADHFKDVLIVEPETWVTKEEGALNVYDEHGVPKDNVPSLQRQRVPQYLSVHGYQPMQLHALRQLFPNFDDELRKVDGRILPNDYKMNSYGGPIMRLPYQDFPNKKDLDGLFLSRQGYELLMRRLLRKSSKRVRWLSGTATGLKHGGDPSIITSVLVRNQDGVEKEIPATLVIDCSGPTQVGLKWLKRIYNSEGLPARPGSLPFDDLRLEYKTSQRYQIFKTFIPPATRRRLPIPGGYDNAGIIYILIPKVATEKCYFVVNRIEGHRLEFTFSGYDDPPIPQSLHEIRDHWLNINKEIPLPPWLFDLLDMVIECKGETESSVMILPTLSWIRYEKAPYIPSNFIPIGDSAMRVNPIFGQGISKAAMGAITLNSMLRTPRYRDIIKFPANFGYDFIKKQSVLIEGVWDGTKPMDYQWPSTTPVKGEKLSDGAFMARYGAIALRVSLTDDKVNSAIWAVKCFLAPPTALLHPAIVLKVAWFWLRHGSEF